MTTVVFVVAGLDAGECESCGRVLRPASLAVLFEEACPAHDQCFCADCGPLLLALSDVRSGDSSVGRWKRWVAEVTN